MNGKIQWQSPVLFKQNTKGGLQRWQSWSSNGKIYTQFGVVGGKLQLSCKKAAGKNKGRANATTAEEQASLEAEALATKMVKRGFVADLHKAQRVKNALPAFLPMLAHRWDEKGEKATFPAFVQPKLDGIRCLAIVKNGKCKLYTRSQKPITTVPHIVTAIEKLSKEKDYQDFSLDGELYNHALKDDFSRILGAVKRGGVSENAHHIHYYVYDVPEILGATGYFSVRLRSLVDLIGQQAPPLVLVETAAVHSPQELETYNEGYVARGFEGTMYRADADYEGRRTTNLLKVKTFFDAEFKVVGANEGKGKVEGKIASFKCVTKPNHPYPGVKQRGLPQREFDATLTGELETWPPIADVKKYVGKILTVKYQGFTALNEDDPENGGRPRFPNAIRFKDAVEA